MVILNEKNGIPKDKIVTLYLDPSQNRITSYNVCYTKLLRTVQSDDCFDISDTVKINVLVPIDNDSIVTNSLIYTCYNTSPQIIDGSSPINGDGIYIYQWMESVITSYSIHYTKLYDTSWCRLSNTCIGS